MFLPNKGLPEGSRGWNSELLMKPFPWQLVVDLQLEFDPPNCLMRQDCSKKKGRLTHTDPLFCRSYRSPIRDS